VAGTYVVGAGIYGTRQINDTRKRWFSDDFVMTPETLRMPYKSVYFQTRDGIELNGWFVEQTVKGKPSSNLIMCCNPYNQDKSTLLGICRGFWDAGYSVLLFDYRSHAKPPRERTIGYKEVDDAKAALSWLLENKPKEGKIGLVGASMGGAVALRLCADVDSKRFDISKYIKNPEAEEIENTMPISQQKVDEETETNDEKIDNRSSNHSEQEHLKETERVIIACATDCAFSSLKRVLGASIDKNFPTGGRLFSQKGLIPLHSLILESVCFINQFWYGYNPENVGPECELSSLTTPLLILHSADDSVVPVEQAHIIYQKSGTRPEEKQLQIVPNTEHIGAYFNSEKEYIRSIVRFLDKRFEIANSSAFVPYAEESYLNTDL